MGSNKMNYTVPSYLPATFTAYWPLLVLVLLWSLVWKGLALWKAARKEDKWWFVFLLIINTMGIAEILYLYVFSKRSLLKDRAPAGKGE